MTILDIHIVSAVFLIANLVLSAYVLHKVRRIHLMSFEIRNDIERAGGGVQLFRQLQALDGLYRDLKFTRALPLMRDWAASPDFLSMLARHALEHRPKVVVECGSGVSTLILARCMQMNGQGRVFSLDHNPQFAEQTRRNLAQHGLAEWAEVIYAPIREHVLGEKKWLWYDLQNFSEVHIDMLVVDGPPMPLGKMIRYPAGPMLLPRLSPTGAVFLDDADRNDERQIIETWVRENPGFRAEKIECEKGCILMRRDAG
jgi:predicted O-methyltransferase YrrM